MNFELWSARYILKNFGKLLKFAKVCGARILNCRASEGVSLKNAGVVN